MEWINTDKELPTYYEVISAELTTGEIKEVWRASDGERNLWTEFSTDLVYLDEDIVKWKRHKLEAKE